MRVCLSAVKPNLKTLRLKKQANSSHYVPCISSPEISLTCILYGNYWIILKGILLIREQWRRDSFRSMGTESSLCRSSDKDISHHLSWKDKYENYNRPIVAVMRKRKTYVIVGGDTDLLVFQHLCNVPFLAKVKLPVWGGGLAKY